MLLEMYDTNKVFELKLQIMVEVSSSNENITIPVSYELCEKISKLITHSLGPGFSKSQKTGFIQMEQRSDMQSS